MTGTVPAVADGLDNDNVTPLFEQLAEILRDRIASGDLTGRMPSEPTLKQDYGVSRDTVRRALAILRDAGLITSRRGRGTFVVPPEQRT